MLSFIKCFERVLIKIISDLFPDKTLWMGFRRDCFLAGRTCPLRTLVKNLGNGKCWPFYSSFYPSRNRSWTPLLYLDLSLFTHGYSHRRHSRRRRKLHSLGQIFNHPQNAHSSRPYAHSARAGPQPTSAPAARCRPRPCSAATALTRACPIKTCGA